MTIQAFFVAAQILDLISIRLFEYNVNKKYLLKRYLPIVPDPFFTIRILYTHFWHIIEATLFLFLHFFDMSRVKRICVFEHSVMTNFNCTCPAIQWGQGSGFLSQGSS